jgi:N-acetylglucosaminyldiphosphoundecaprenol N-acetyl-beta-D-mannosaminyltransferase
MVIPRANILGVGVDAINMDITLDTIDHWIHTRENNYICLTIVYSVMLCQRDEKLRNIFNSAGLVAPVGMPLVWLSHLKGFTQISRVYDTDLMLAVAEISEQKGYRHFIYGGREGVPEQAAKEFKRHCPGIAIVGTYSPPFRPLTREEDDNIVQMINESHADIVWVALGCPKQERWMAAHVNRLTAPVLIGVGAGIDFFTGQKRQAPRFIQRIGLEGIFRFVNEPRRLWKRALVYIPLFVLCIIAQALGLREYQIESVTPQQNGAS